MVTPIKILVHGNEFLPILTTKILIEVAIMLLGSSSGIDFWCDPAAQDHFFGFLVEIYCDIVTVWQVRQISPNDVIVGKKRFPFEFKNIELGGFLKKSFQAHDVPFLGSRLG